MDKISFSVIIPCYNVEKYVVHCVEKLQRQTYKDMEIILIDDGSTDGTFALCKELEKRYDNVVSITHDHGQEATRNRGQEATRNRGLEATRNRGLEATRNRGLEATRNRGLEATRGEWVCFLDADDELLDDTLQRAKETFERHPEIDFILTGLAYIYEDGSPERVDVANLPEGIYSAKEIAENALSRIQWPVISCVGTKIYRREFIERNALRFDIRYKFNEDGAFAVNALWAAKNIAHLPVPAYRYLQRAGSIMHSYRPNAFDSLDRVNTLLSDYFDHYGVLPQKEVMVQQKRWALVRSLLYEHARYKGRIGFMDLSRELWAKQEVRRAFESQALAERLNAASGIEYILFKHRLFTALYGWLMFKNSVKSAEEKVYMKLHKTNSGGGYSVVWIIQIREVLLNDLPMAAPDIAYGKAC